MAIQLIDRDERFIATVAGSDFYYRRPTLEDYRKIVRQNTHRGVTDNAGVNLDLAKFCLIGWGTVLDIAGKPVPFSTEAVAALPTGAIDDIGDLIAKNVSGERPLDPTRTSGNTSAQ